jgi:DNA (cytosine-5)-methyltransferase 1
VGGTTTGLVHPWEVRKLTIDEAKALASYPKAFEIRGGYNARWVRVGNSVAPLFMRAIARHIRWLILQADKSSDEIMSAQKGHL